MEDASIVSPAYQSPPLPEALIVGRRLTSGGSLRDGAGRGGCSRGRSGGRTALAQSQPDAAASNVALPRLRRAAHWPPGVGRREPARQARWRSRGKRGAATGALIAQRLGAVLVVGMQPPHYGLRMAAGARRHLRGAGAFSDIMQRQEAFAAAGMGGIEGHLTQIRLRLAPTVVVNS